MKKKLFVYFIYFLIINESFAKPMISSKIIYYDIYPNSKKDIKRALFEKTPIILDGYKYLGVTNWDVSLKYNFFNKNNYCSAINLKTIAKIIIVLPRISKKHKVNYNTKSSFRIFFNKIKKHEKKHEYYIIEATHEIDKKLSKIKSQLDCKNLKKKFDYELKKIIKKYNKKNKEFDEKTKKGYNKKASLDSYL